MRETHLIVSDFHIPDHNHALIKPLLALIKDLSPDKLHILGDFINLTKASHYDPDPYYHVELSEEIEEGTRLLSKFRKAMIGEILWYEGNHECFDSKTEILSQKGWINYTQITKDTNLVTFDKDRDCLEIEKPIEIQQYNYDGELYAIKNRHTDLLITPNHRLYFKYNQFSKWKTKEIKKMTIGQNRVYMRTSSTFNEKEFLITDDEIRICAWLFTDGYMGKYAVTFYQRISKVYMIEEILNRLGWRYTRHERKREDITHIDGKKLIQHEVEVNLNLLQPYRSLIEKLVKDKHILSDWVYKLSDRQFDIFLNSFIDGDGSRHKSAPLTSLMVYGRKKIIEELQRACFIHGYRTSISEYRKGDYRLNINKSKITSFDRFKDNVSNEYYKGIVWDVTTPNDTVIVRRNGKISITGNCRLVKYLARNALALAELNIEGERIVSIPHLFNLRELGVKYIGMFDNHKEGDVMFEHGSMVRIKSGYTAHAMIERRGTSGVIGHTHRLSLVTKTMSGRSMFWIENGCLCNLNPTPRYVNMPDWTNGFSIITFIKGVAYPQVIPIINNSFTYNGTIYS